MLAVRPLRSNEWDDARLLSVAPDQADLVASAEESLNDAARYPGAEPLGVFVDDTLVGLTMGQLIPGVTAHDPWLPAGSYLLWDYFIDHRYQRRGYGRGGIVGAVAVAHRAGARSVIITYEPHNRVARDLYLSLGFEETGHINRDGERVLRITFPQP